MSIKNSENAGPGVDQDILEFDPKAAYTMKAMNVVGLSIEQMIETAQRDIYMRKGVIAGLVAAGPLVDKTKNEVQKNIDSEAIEGETAKIVLAWLQKARDEISTSVAMNQRELAVQEGIVEGLKKATERCEGLFKQEESKVRIRKNEAERGHRDEDGRPKPLREIMAERALFDGEIIQEEVVQDETLVSVREPAPETTPDAPTSLKRGKKKSFRRN
jgi:hypothetical protein